MPQMSNGQETLVGRDSVLMENRNTREGFSGTLLQDHLVRLSRIENMLADLQEEQKYAISLHSESNGQEKLVGRASDLMENGNTRKEPSETQLQEHLERKSRLENMLADLKQQQQKNSERNRQEKLVGRASVLMENRNTREDSSETLLQEHLVKISRIQKRLVDPQERTDSDSKAAFKRGVIMFLVLFICFVIATLIRNFTDYFPEQKISEKPICQGTSQGVS